MPIVVVDCQTSGSGAVNEDHASVTLDLAWVIDGATDVVEVPLTPAATDADWLAGRLDAALKDIATSVPADLTDLPSLTARRLASDFSRDAIRQPAARREHHSASGVVVRAGPEGLDYVAVGDCSLLAFGSDGLVRAGVEADAAGDRDLAAALAALHDEHGDLDADGARARVWPSISAGRVAMNEPDGYGVFSITPTPTRFVHSGRISMQPGGHVLLASDGLMRLVDVFGRYTEVGLLDAAGSSGLEPLIGELRAIEAEDAVARRYPRAKVSDDATGLLLRWT
jgi:hypothetical protein